MKARMTKKWIKKNVSLSSNALPGSLVNNVIRYSDEFQKMIDEFTPDDWDMTPAQIWNAHPENKLMKRLEKLGYIENRGCMVLTQSGYRAL